MGGRGSLKRSVHLGDLVQRCTHDRTVEPYMALGPLWVSDIVWKHCLGIDIALVIMVPHHGALPWAKIRTMRCWWLG